MKILVTGANGYLGQGVVKKLLECGMTVVATDFKCDNIDEKAIKKQCDMFKIEEPYEYFEKPDVVLHMAWRDGFVHNSANHFEDLPKHYFFIKKLIDSGVKHVAVIGTMHEIGFYEGSINENTPTNPMSLYGISKDALRRATELICREAGAVFQWLRGFYIVGNTQYGCSIFSKIAKAEQENEATFPFTTGQNQWDFIDYTDFCDQVAAAVIQQDITGIINICSGKPEKLADRVERFIAENNYNIKLAYGQFPDRIYDSKAVWGNDEKIRKILENTKRGE